MLKEYGNFVGICDFTHDSHSAIPVFNYFEKCLDRIEIRNICISTFVLSVH